MPDHVAQFAASVEHLSRNLGTAMRYSTDVAPASSAVLADRTLRLAETAILRRCDLRDPVPFLPPFHGLSETVNHRITRRKAHLVSKTIGRGLDYRRIVRR